MTTILALPTGVELDAVPDTPDAEAILSVDALRFVADLHRALNPERLRCLSARAARQAELDAGGRFNFLPETSEVRAGDWRVVETPPDLMRRWTEITGPVDRKMMITALSCGADVFMADFEDALSPTWANVVAGQVNLRDAVRRTISVALPDGRGYALGDRVATLVVRPRGWHLPERHVRVDGAPISASLFDFGLYLFHNAAELIARGSGPYFYLPKMESHLEARLWNRAFELGQDALGVPRGTIRATALIETLPAAFEMDEILYELRDHAAGLNAGRWDYIFSAIKRLRTREDAVLPDRAQVTMTVPFMRAYTDLLVQTCHRRGAHAIGGMAAFVPNRRDADATGVAMRKVSEDKRREAGDRFDGSWVAHPDLVPLARRVFEAALNGMPPQRHQRRADVRATPDALQDLRVPGGTVTTRGVRENVSVSLQYLNAWLGGTGAAAINHLMEDVATAEISRAQLWQWLRHATPLDDGSRFTPTIYAQVRDEVMTELTRDGAHHFPTAARLLDRLVLDEHFEEFLTTHTYPELP
ncbi:MAG: malate synthase A [Dehalococcoidia bacterium]